ncbi:MAG: phytanoyl-CoA dioxygenase family protein [Alphaproteobacteria bacterium]
MADRDFGLGADKLAQFEEEGFFVLPSVVSDEDVAMLRRACDEGVDFIDRALDEQGCDVIGLNHRDRRYILPLQYKKSDQLQGFLFGELMAAVCRATLGPEAYLFLEQFVVKGAQTGMELGWHQDAGYLGFTPPFYITAWVALDDVNEDNGTVYMLPYAAAGTRARVDHALQAGSNDQVGYFGDDPGIPVIAPAGSMAVFTCNTFHRSGGNKTERPRRAYLGQYSKQPILRPDGSGPRHFADAFLRQGSVVPQPGLSALKAAPAMPWTW